MEVLLISNKWDVSIDFVIKELKKKNASFVRLNTEDLIKKNTSVTFPNFSYSVEHKKIDHEFVNKITSVYFRRPGKPFEFDSDKKLKKSMLTFISEQWYSFILGLESLPNLRWINHPLKNEFAEIKINQLNFAKNCGFKIPRTCITTDKNRLIEFSKECNNEIISKALYSPLVRDQEKEFFIFTNKVDNVNEINENDLSLAPTIFQENLIGKQDYRITVIGNDCYTVKINYNNQEIDWRKIKSNIKLVEDKIPSDISKKCCKLVSNLGLVFGAIDLVKVKDEYYFLEINPNGEWGWIENQTSLPIAKSICDYLTKTNRK